MNNPLEVLHDADGSLSSTRLAFLLWALGPLVVWAWVCIRSGAVVPIDGSVITIIGVMMSGKVVQKFSEKPAV